VRPGIGEFGFGFKALSNDLIGGLAVEHALMPGIVGGVEAAQELLPRAMRVNSDSEHLTADAAIEPLG
jgi:hypothetical protein